MDEFGATVILLDSEDRVLLQLRDDKPDIPYPAHWGLFGGSGEPGETPEEAAKREVAEETGIALERITLLREYTHYRKPNKREYAFIAHIDEAPETVLEGRECRFFSKDEFESLKIIPQDKDSIDAYFREQIHLTIVSGARPNFMKIAPIIKELKKRSIASHTLIHTGQHFDQNMSDVFFSDLGIEPPAVNFGVHSMNIPQQTAKIKIRFDEYLQENPTNYVVVVGDVTSTFACGYVAKHRNVPLIHVEAGLRSFDNTMPEEMNRRFADYMSDLLFVTEESGMHNIRQEKLAGKAHFVGNVMIDTLVNQLPSIRSTLQQKHRLKPRSYAVATFHRPANTDTKEALQAVIDILKEMAQHMTVVFPVHPRTQQALTRHELHDELNNVNDIICTEPLGYNEFIGLVKDAALVVTDSGGIQEETTFLGVPCITMRTTTERPVTCTIGSNVLCPTPREVKQALGLFFNGQWKKSSVPPLWDGKTAQRIVQAIIHDYFERKL